MLARGRGSAVRADVFLKGGDVLEFSLFRGVDHQKLPVVFSEGLIVPSFGFACALLICDTCPDFRDPL